MYASVCYSSCSACLFMPVCLDINFSLFSAFNFYLCLQYKHNIPYSLIDNLPQEKERHEKTKEKPERKEGKGRPSHFAS